MDTPSIYSADSAAVPPHLILPMADAVTWGKLSVTTFHGRALA